MRWPTFRFNRTYISQAITSPNGVWQNDILNAYNADHQKWARQNGCSLEEMIMDLELIRIIFVGNGKRWLGDARPGRL